MNTRTAGITKILRFVGLSDRIKYARKKKQNPRNAKISMNQQSMNSVLITSVNHSKETKMTLFLSSICMICINIAWYMQVRKLKEHNEHLKAQIRYLSKGDGLW